MCQCVGFPMIELVVPGWRRALLRLLLKLRSWAILVPGVEVELFNARTLEHRASGHLSRRNSLQRSLVKARRTNGRLSGNGAVCMVKVRQERCDPTIDEKPRKEPRLLLETVLVNSRPVRDVPWRFVVSGGGNNVSLYSKQGMKGVNQDAMLVMEDFAAQTGTIFCGVFDGHGPDGHLVACRVRDLLPEKLASCWQASVPSGDDFVTQGFCFSPRAAGDPRLITAWKESFLEAHKMMDRELLVQHEIDCVSSGTTAVTLVKQGNDLFIGNVGDSRAILGMASDDNSLMALQLTIDLKPNLPKEAERIKQFKGRVFALRNEPMVKRVWLPHANAPGLAMARSLGDYCLKRFGVISEPVITYRRVTVKDKFVVLASDGVWDVLSNEQVVEIVASVSERALAAKAIVYAAASVWKVSRPMWRADDCTAVCYFLDDVATTSAFQLGREHSHIRRSLSSVVSLQSKLITSENRLRSSSEVELLRIASTSETESISASTASGMDALPANTLGTKKRKIPA